MASYAAKLGIKIQTLGANKAKDELNGLSESSEKADNSAKGLTNSSGSLSKSFSTVSGTAKTAAVGVAAAAAAMTATAVAINAMVNSSIESARELKSLAFSADVSVERLQSLAFAAKNVGLETKDLSDIYKDMSDRVGDFIATGAGPAADFFEKIAPQVGVTADQFKRLAAPDALQLYVSSLEKAGLSQAEMVFYMEALSSESTRMLPLLTDGGKKMGELSEKATELGLSLSEIEVTKLAQAGEGMVTLTKVTDTLTSKLAAQFAPVIGGISDMIVEMSGDTGNLGTISERIFNGIITGVGFVGDAMRGMQIIVKGVELAFWGLNAGTAVVFNSIVQGFDELNQGIQEKTNDLIDIFNAIPGVADMEHIAVGQTEFAAAMDKTTQDAKDKFNEMKTELHDIMMEPLPSDALDKWVADASAAADEKAQNEIDRAKALRIAQVESSDEGDESEGNSDRQKLVRDGWAKHWQIMADNEKAIQATTDADSLEQAKATAAAKQTVQANLVSGFGQLMESGSKREFELGKAGSISMALINTYQGVTKALGQGGLWGMAAAASVAAMGIANVNKIASTKFGGKGGSPTVSAPPAATTGSSDTGGQSSQGSNINISLAGESVGRVTFENLIETINSQLDDGKTINSVRLV